MSPNQVYIEFRNVRSADETTLSQFLTSVGDVRVEKTAYAVKAEVELIQIVVGIIGAWAAERYFLDPLADRLDEWLRVMGSLEGKKFKVVVNFQDSHVKSFETLQISNPFLLKELWRILKAASDLLAYNPEQDAIDKVMIVPHKTRKVLVVGYTAKRPTHLLNIENNRIVPLNKKHKNDKSLRIIFWEIEQLSLRLEQLRMRYPSGDEEIEALEHEIDEMISSCL